MKRASLIVAVAMALLLPACGEDSTTTVVPPPVAAASPSPSPSAAPEPSPSPVPSPTPQPTPEPSPEPTPTPEPLPDITINIVNMAFQPASVTAKVGQRIVWKNKDTQTHTATSGEFATGFIDPGAQASAVIQSVGEFGYYCSVHPTMKGTVTVEK
jgi:outer membrane biosynthesis protein TonB